MIVVLFVVLDCAVKLLSLIMKSLALGSMDMVVVRQIDDGNRRYSCQRVNTGHKLTNHNEFFPFSISLQRYNGRCEKQG